MRHGVWGVVASPLSRESSSTARSRSPRRGRPCMKPRRHGRSPIVSGRFAADGLACGRGIILISCVNSGSYKLALPFISLQNVQISN